MLKPQEHASHSTYMALNIKQHLVAEVGITKMCKAKLRQGPANIYPALLLYLSLAIW